MADTWMEALAAHLVANSLGTEGVDLFVGMMNDTDQPGPVLGLAMYKGTTRETMGGHLDVPMLQVAVRAPSYKDAEARIVAARDLLRAITDQTIEGFRFVRVQPDGYVKDIQRDGKGRQMFTADFEVWL